MMCPHTESKGYIITSVDSWCFKVARRAWKATVADGQRDIQRICFIQLVANGSFSSAPQPQTPLTYCKPRF